MTTNENKRPYAILVGYGASDCSTAAIEGLRRAALPEHGVAYVMSVAETADTAATLGFGNITVAPADIAELVRALKDSAALSARKGAELLRAVLPGWTVDAQAPEGSAYWSLIAHAERHRVDLIVLGSHGRSSLDRALLGSTSQFVVAHANCSVRVSRCDRSTTGSAKDDPSRPLLLFLAIDGSAGADAVIEHVAARQWPAGTQVHVFTAVDLGVIRAIAARAAGEPARAELNTAAAILKHAKYRLEAAGLSVSKGLKLGNPKSVIVEEAERWDSDVIFVGAQGHSRIGRLFLGSVSAAVAERAHCSVEIVRLPAPISTISRPTIALPATVEAGATQTKEMSCC